MIHPTMRARFSLLLLVLAVACSDGSDAPAAAGALGGVDEAPAAVERPKTIELPPAKETKPSPKLRSRILTEQAERDSQTIQKIGG